jgi:protein pelota
MQIKLLLNHSDGSGKLVVTCHNGEDMWNVHNLINIGDIISATTQRKVNIGSNGDNTREILHLALRVTASQFDFESATLRISGTNTTPNEFVKLGAYHTMEIECHRQFSVSKDRWDEFHLMRLKEAEKSSFQNSANVIIVVMDSGSAHICAIGTSMTHILSKVQYNVPKKHVGSSGIHDKGLQKFYELLYAGIERHVDWNVTKVLILASPGFYKDDFYSYMISHATQLGNQGLLNSKSKILRAHASSGNPRSIPDVLSDPNLSALLADTRAAKETSALAAFFAVLRKSPEKAVYGFRHLRVAVDRAAVSTLLIGDNLLRDGESRVVHIKLISDARANGSEVLILSSVHSSGEALMQIGGVAGILRYPCPDLDEAAAALPKLKSSNAESRTIDENRDDANKPKSDLVLDPYASDDSSDSDASYKTRP